MQIELSDGTAPGLRAAILAPLAAHNQASTGRTDPGTAFAILLRDAAGAVEGGMVASCWLGWAKLETAFLPAHRRRKGLGARMLAALEAALAAHGAEGLWTTSYDFQAPGFYRRLGFRDAGTLADHPPGHTEYFLCKTGLAGAPGEDLPVIQAPAPEECEAVRRAIRAYNDDRIGPASRSLLALALRDETGAVRGGLWGQIGRGWLFVDLLGLPPEARGAGLGTRLLRMAEAEARARGCIGVWLDTFSFQARPFYEKLGYTLFGQIDGYPRGHTRFFLQRRLDRP